MDKQYIVHLENQPRLSVGDTLYLIRELSLKEHVIDRININVREFDGWGQAKEISLHIWPHHYPSDGTEKFYIAYWYWSWSDLIDEQDIPEFSGTYKYKVVNHRSIYLQRDVAEEELNRLLAKEIQKQHGNIEDILRELAQLTHKLTPDFILPEKPLTFLQKIRNVFTLW